MAADASAMKPPPTPGHGHDSEWPCRVIAIDKASRQADSSSGIRAATVVRE
jgi:hypothetical protein